MAKRFYVKQFVMDDAYNCASCGQAPKCHTVREEGRIYRVLNLLDAVETVPSAAESVKDRVVLVASDGTKFYTHATIVCQSSPVLQRYYHGDYESQKATFDLPEADSWAVRALLRYIYVNAQPEAELHSFLEIIRVAHFLRVRDFEDVIVEIVAKFKREKLLTTDDWITLYDRLSFYEYRSAQALVWQDFAKTSSGEST